MGGAALSAVGKVVTEASKRSVPVKVVGETLTTTVPSATNDRRWMCETHGLGSLCVPSKTFQIISCFVIVHLSPSKTPTLCQPGSHQPSGLAAALGPDIMHLLYFVPVARPQCVFTFLILVRSAQV